MKPLGGVLEFQSLVLAAELEDREAAAVGQRQATQRV